MTATIPLAKGLDIDKLDFPVFFSQKLDGVPVKLTVRQVEECHAVCSVVTRSGENAFSAANDMLDFAEKLNKLDILDIGPEYVFVFETTHKDYTLFKDISGVVRRKEPQQGLVYNLFDFWRSDKPEANFSNRTVEGQNLVIEAELYDKFKVVRQTPMSRDHLIAALDEPMAADQEGWIVRSWNALFKPGARHWDYQKVVKEPMIDLRIIGFTEGKGKNSGAVGSLIAEYKGRTTEVGAGKLSYAERKELWDTHGSDRLCRIAQIKYKPDEGYEKLRQPTFQCWRDDKDTPDA